jgi:hypothetical protein
MSARPAEPLGYIIYILNSQAIQNVIIPQPAEKKYVQGIDRNPSVCGTFLLVLQSIEQFRNTSHLSAWLLKSQTF